MQSVVGRRGFVGSVAAGLPLMASGGARAQSGQDTPLGHHTAHVHPAGGDIDPIAAHLFTQMATAHNRMRRGPRGEDARAFAAALRTLSVHARVQALDTAITTATRRAEEREGRYALLSRDHDLENVRREVETFGLSLDPSWRMRFVAVDPRRRARALDRVLAEGVTPTLDRVATLLERAAAQIDRRAGTVARVSRQTDADWYAGFCEQLQKELDDVQDVMAVFCGMYGLVGIFMKYPCTAVALAYFGLTGVQIFNC
jgi:hypothetical protein